MDIIVDGYNLIAFDQGLGGDLERKRNWLAQQLASYQRLKGFGVSVVFVAPGGPVDRAGIRRYDILVAFDDQQLTTSAGLAALSASREPGDEVALTALRKGKARAFPTVLGDCRDAPPAAAAMFAPDLSFGDLVSEILDRNSKTLQVELSPDGALQLRLGDHFNAVEDLFNLLKRQPAGKGLLWETRPLKREQVHVETAEAEVTIFRDSDGGTRVVATDKLTGAELYSGTVDPPPGKDMPPEVRAIVERALPMLEKPGEFRGTERAPQAPQAPGARQ